MVHDAADSALSVVILCSTDELVDLAITSCVASEAIPLVVLNRPSDLVRRIVDRHAQLGHCSVALTMEHGLGGLREAATRLTPSDHVLQLDSDCQLSHSVVAEILASFQGGAQVVKPPMVYRSTGIPTRVVSRCRSFTTPIDFPHVPIAFDRRIAPRVGGYIFDARLDWGEDRDLAMRLHASRIPIDFIAAPVWHAAQGPRADAKSAFRLGEGRSNQVEIGILQPRSVVRDIELTRELKSAFRCGTQAGIAAGIYHLALWRPVYKLGYWTRRISRWRQGGSQ